MSKQTIIIQHGSLKVKLDGDFENGPEIAIGLFEKAAQYGIFSTPKTKTSAPECEQQKPLNSNKLYDLSVESICLKLNASSATDLIIAAGLHLKFVQQKNDFSRAELLETIKKATSYYKETISNNLTTTINKLVKNDKFLQRSSGKYALSHKLITESISTLDSIT